MRGTMTDHCRPIEIDVANEGYMKEEKRQHEAAKGNLNREVKKLCKKLTEFQVLHLKIHRRRNDKT
jgi:N-formylglutamate amidohydrolase